MADAATPSRAPRTSLPQLGDRQRLGRTDLVVSPFCLGLSTEEAVVAAFRAGINFFFVSVDLHWPKYEGTRAGLRRLLRDGVARDELVVAATAYVAQPEFLTVPFAELLEAVPELERIDVVVAGGAYAADLPPRLAAMRDHVGAGRFGARAAGASFHDRAAAVEPLNRGDLDVGFGRYNPAHLGARRAVFPHLAPDRAARLYNFTSTTGLAQVRAMVEREPDQDLWIPAVPDYYRFALAEPHVDGILCALFRPEHVDELVETLAGPPLAEDEVDHMIALVDAATNPPG